MIRIGDAKLSATVKTLAELDAFLERRINETFNSFWLSHVRTEYPKLAILVNKDCAALTYLPRDGHPGWIPMHGDKGITTDGETVFRLSESHADDVWVPNGSVVKTGTAIAAGRDFFASPDRPSCIEWFEL